MGPTASGKTAMAVSLAKQFNFEIISVDSALVFKEMNIGTSKPCPQILAEAPHHLIDLRNPNQSYSVAEFCQDAVACITEIQERGRIPLLVGGTMLYFHALQTGLSNLPASDPEIRAQVLSEAKMLGWENMHQRLAEVDKVRALTIHPHDKQRIQRALEVYYLSQQPFSSFQQSKKLFLSDPFINLVLFPEDRSWLHQNIENRFKTMLKEGFIEEVEELLQKWELNLDNPSLRAVGYRQVFEYLNQPTKKLEDLEAKGAAATRQLAKRQLTWLRRWQDASFFRCEERACLDKIQNLIQQYFE